MILPPSHFIVFNQEVNRLMRERSYTFKPSIQKMKDEYLETILDSPLRFSNILLPE